MNKAAILLVAMIIGFTSVLSSPSVLVAAPTSIACDVVQGFQFSAGQTTPVGHLTYLKIGDTTLGSDLDIADPENPFELTSVIGVLDDIYWEGGAADPIQFTAQLSNANKNTLAALLVSIVDTSVLLGFNVYEYDSASGKYYKSFHTNSVNLVSLIENSGGSLVAFIDPDQAMDVVSPINFSFLLGVMPDNVINILHLAISVSDKFAAPWGVTGGTPPNISTSETIMDFGPVQAGETPSRILTVYNGGSNSLVVGAVGQANPLEAPYLITADTCSGQIVSGGGDCSITVTFEEPLLASLAVPATGSMGLVAGSLMLFGGMGRRRRIAAVLLIMVVSGAVLISCGGGSSPDAYIPTEYTGAFDLPSNDPASTTVTIEVTGAR